VGRIPLAYRIGRRCRRVHRFQKPPEPATDRLIQLLILGLIDPLNQVLTKGLI